MSSTIEVRAPSEQSEGTRSQVQRWLKAVGETVAENEPLIEVETDKVTIEIPAPASGVLHEILKREQEEIEPGELLARIQISGTQSDTPRSRDPKGNGAPVANSSGAAPRSKTEAALAAHAAALMARKLSPAVRRLLELRGLEPAGVRGTGEGGRITVDDVLAHASQVALPRHESPVEEVSEPVAKQPATKAERSIPHSSMRKRIAQRMVDSLLHTAPHVTTVFEADLTAVLAHRAKHREEFASRGASLTLTAYILAACVDAIREVPEANSRWTSEALEIQDSIDIGVGTALEGQGLIVPVVHNVQSLDLFGIAQRLSDLVSKAREDKLSAADVRGGTFTISNHGVSGSLLAAPIVINQPQSAILGVGKMEKRAVVVTENGEDRVMVRSRCYVTLTIDHRVMDGHRANRFLEVLIRRLETWQD
ncbi:MAG TPA: dihydrolipoamide acetyltransferase family protein [Steroidobacteraceae bacterium]|jgi:2-oxoglutarate dehydrogenase E2 component (dihydrolipoamide succinyltransferase)